MFRGSSSVLPTTTIVIKEAFRNTTSFRDLQDLHSKPFFQHYRTITKRSCGYSSFDFDIFAAGLAAFHHKEVLRVPGDASTRRGAVARTVPKRAVGFHRRGPPNEPHSPLTDPSPVCLCSGSRRRCSAPGRLPQPSALTRRRRGPRPLLCPKIDCNEIHTGEEPRRLVVERPVQRFCFRELLDRRDRAAPLAPL